jgi:hypothetical protein
MLLSNGLATRFLYLNQNASEAGGNHDLFELTELDDLLNK